MAERNDDDEESFGVVVGTHKERERERKKKMLRAW